MRRFLKIEIKEPVVMPLANNGFGEIYKEYFHQPYGSEKEKQALIECFSSEPNVIKITAV